MYIKLNQEVFAPRLSNYDAGKMHVHAFALYASARSVTKPTMRLVTVNPLRKLVTVAMKQDLTVHSLLC